MPPVNLDPKAPIPPGISEADAKRAALRVATLEVVDRRRRDPLALSGRVPASLHLTSRGGVEHRGRPTHAWSFRVASLEGLPPAEYHLIGVQAQRQTYYSAYPAMLTIDEAETILGDWISADGKAYSERERVLSVYRARLADKPGLAGRHHELALIGTTLSTCFATLTRLDAIHYPGPLEEFVPAALEAVARMPQRASALALAAFLHERLARFEAAARLYGEAADADPASRFYALLHADCLLFAGDVAGAKKAARRADARARTLRSPYRFGLHRPAILDRFKETLHEEAERLRARVEGVKRRGLSEAALAREHRRAIRLDPVRVPPSFRDLIPLARRWGVGDDASRGYLTDRATAKQRAALRKALPLGRRREIQDWLDSLGLRGITSHEAGAFMYLLEAFEEMGL